MLSFANQTIVYKNNFHHSNAWFKWMTSTSLPSIKPKLPACHPLRSAIGIGPKANHHVRPKSNPEMICYDMASWYQKFDRIRHSICPHFDFPRRQSPVVFQKMHQVDQAQAKLHDRIFYERQPVPRRHSNFLCSAKEALL